MTELDINRLIIGRQIIINCVRIIIVLIKS